MASLVSPLSSVLVVGGGPAGLMAAEVIAGAGAAVEVCDAMPSVGRKFLMAGRGGMNITHSEAPDAFVARYGDRAPQMGRLLAAFGPQDLREWMHGLGIESFIGSSGRVFPVGMKAAPLLRSWLHRLRAQGVRFQVRHRWLGWGDRGRLRFQTPDGVVERSADAVVLALGGGSWSRLGSDGAWVPLLAGAGVSVAPLQPANCGFDVGWSDHFRDRFAGQPLKTVGARVLLADGRAIERLGEFVVTQHGIEGSLVYALSSPLRDSFSASGASVLWLDLLPARSLEWVHKELQHPRGARSLASHLQSRLGLRGVKVGLLRECLPPDSFSDLAVLARGIKALPLTLKAPRPLDEAISSAGGVCFSSLTQDLMLQALPGVFCAGEMLDWEAPTGGYLLTGCFATGRAAGEGTIRWLRETRA